MEPWYRVVTLREEVREGRSFSPDEFAIALEQVVNGTAPPDYRDPVQFFKRTYFTRALSDHTGMTLRRLAGSTENTAPVLSLVSQFGGGKTHTLTALYHLANEGPNALRLDGVAQRLIEFGLGDVPQCRVGVFTGNAWDPSPGNEAPWIDLARQVAGEAGVEALGPSARETAPGTEALARVFAAANAPVLLLFDEVLNFINRHRAMAEGFYAFIQNLTVAATGATRVAAIISLPRSQTEMTPWDQEWQERINKVVRRVAQDLIANDEGEISEVVRRRLFEDLGGEQARRNAARAYADWCFERSARLPAEWTAVDTATGETQARDFLRDRFAACYPFHPATLSVFQRKWRALPQFQQTRGALALLAQWVSFAAREQFRQARTEPLITLGSAPLDDETFLQRVLGQLGEERLRAAIHADIAGANARVRPLDADATGAMRNLHKRVGTAILFESSGGQIDKVAHLPELRFALGEPDVETTSIDNAAVALEGAGFFIRRVGSDGYRIHHQATLRKVVSDRRASLEENAVLAAIKEAVKKEFSNTGTSAVFFPEDGASVLDSPRLTLVVVDPALEWIAGGQAQTQIAAWTTGRGELSRLYPASLVWCVRRQGRELRQSVEMMLAWRQVDRELRDGMLGDELDQSERGEVQRRVKDAVEAVADEVWAGYRYVALHDARSETGLKVIDLGAGHSSGNETLTARILGAMRSEALLNDTVGVGYIDRHWPPSLQDSGAWPLSGLRQAFLDGSLTRLADPDTVLRHQITGFVANGDFGLASGERSGGYGRVWFKEPVGQEEVQFESGVFLLRKAVAERLTAPPVSLPSTGGSDPSGPTPVGSGPTLTQTEAHSEQTPEQQSSATPQTLRLYGDVPAEVWNRMGTTLMPKLRADEKMRASLKVSLDITVDVDPGQASNVEGQVRQALSDLGLADQLNVE